LQAILANQLFEITAESSPKYSFLNVFSSGDIVKIGIFGGKSYQGGGFSDAMSISQVHGFSANGCSVVLVSDYLSSSESEIEPERQLVESVGASCVNTQDALKVLSECDWVVWNSYRATDKDLLSELRKNVRITKSFPRIFGLSSEENFELHSNRVKSFDFVAYALKQDFEVAVELSGDEGTFGYVPRGFISDWLISGSSPERTNGFKICVDGPVIPRKNSEHWNAQEVMSTLDTALKKVSHERELRSLVSSRVKLNSANASRLGSLSLYKFYKSFFQDADLYISPRLSLSRHAESAFVGDSYRGLYENQIIESQIAGSMILGEKFSIHSELKSPSQFGDSLDFADVDQMTSLIVTCLDESRARKEATAEWAKRKHDSIVAMSIWKKFLEDC